MNNVKTEISEIKKLNTNPTFEYNGNLFVNEFQVENIELLKDLIKRHKKIFFINNNLTFSEKLKSLLGKSHMVWNIMYSNNLRSHFLPDQSDKSYRFVNKKKLLTKEKNYFCKMWQLHYVEIILKDSSREHKILMSSIFKEMLEKEEYTVVYRGEEIVALFYKVLTGDLILKRKVYALFKWINIELSKMERDKIHYMYQELFGHLDEAMHVSIEVENIRSYEHFKKYGFMHSFTGVSAIE